MITAVQLRRSGTDAPRCELLHGDARSVVAGELGPVALFAPEQIVGYALRFARRTRVFVFRTLGADDPLAVRVPGVSPHVQLLLNLRSAARARLLKRMFAFLARRELSASGLPDGFYLRVATVLGGRLPPQKVLSSLLPSSSASPTWTF